VLKTKRHGWRFCQATCVHEFLDQPTNIVHHFFNSPEFWRWMNVKSEVLEVQLHLILVETMHNSSKFFSVVFRISKPATAPGDGFLSLCVKFNFLQERVICISWTICYINFFAHSPDFASIPPLIPSNKKCEIWKNGCWGMLSRKIKNPHILSDCKFTLIKKYVKCLKKRSMLQNSY